MDPYSLACRVTGSTLKLFAVGETISYLKLKVAGCSKRSMNSAAKLYLKCQRVISKLGRRTAAAITHSQEMT